MDGASENTATLTRAAIKAAGGDAYEALLAKERAARALFRQRHPDKVHDYHRQNPRHKRRDVKSHLVKRAKRRARKAGMEATITVRDLVWPTHCPVLGIELDYQPNGQRDSRNPGNPSLDRWDNTKGYVPGNVFVISMRANVLKSNATAAELEAVMRYARDGMNFMRLVA